MKNAENHQPSSHPTINLSAHLCVLCASAFIFLICGCGPDPRDARIEKLEKQVTSLEENEENIQTNLHDVLHAEMDSATAMKTNLDAINFKLSVLQFNYGEISNRIAEQNSAALPTPARAGTAGPVTTATKNGVPISVYNQIAADAAREWPESYSMQVAVIEHECETWLKLHPQKN
jgi:hypothetical protein